MNKLLRITAASEILGVCPSSLRDLDKRGLLVAHRDWSGHRRYLESDVVEFREKMLRGEIQYKDRDIEDEQQTGAS